MKYSITKIRTTPVPYVDKKTGGQAVFNKVELKTDKTGENILELGYGHLDSVKKSLKVGDVVCGYVENKPWFKSDGTQGGFNRRLNGITADYVYKLLLSIHPDIEDVPKVEGAIEYPTEVIDPNDIPF
jgi:hypothetical protein